MSQSEAPEDLITAIKTIAVLSVVFSVIYALFVGINHAWKLQTPEVISEQWVAVGASAVAFFTLLIASLRKHASSVYYYGIGSFIIITYLSLITFTVYSQRGMASTAIVLYIIPVLIAAVTRATAAVFISAGMSAALYCLAALKYFRDFPSEGYKAELYGQLFFYSIIIFLIAGFIVTLLISKRSQRKM